MLSVTGALSGFCNATRELFTHPAHLVVRAACPLANSGGFPDPCTVDDVCGPARAAKSSLMVLTHLGSRGKAVQNLVLLVLRV